MKKIGTLVIKTFTLILVSGLIMTSCKKAVDGKDGQDGEPGKDGEPGTANVIYSAWLSGNAARDTTIDGTTMKVRDIPAAAITEAIMNSGTILVYVKFGSTTSPLPYTSYAGGKANTISFIPKPGAIIIMRFSHDGSAPVGLGSGNAYRFVVIPGGVLGNSARSKALQINPGAPSVYSAMSYEEICREFDIK